MGQIIAFFTDGTLANHEYWTYEVDPLADTTAPTINLAEVQPSGTELVITFSESVMAGADGWSGLSLSLSGGAVTPTYSSGNNSSQITFSLDRTIGEDETGTLDHTQPGDGIQDLAGNLLSSVSGVSVGVTSNLAPVITGDTSFSLQPDEDFTAEYTITYLDGNTPTLTGANSGLFSIASLGGEDWRLSMDGQSAGTYEVTINADDGVNAVTTLDITVTHVANVAPVIVVLGDSEVTTVQGFPYEDAGAEASDEEDGDLTSQIETANPVNTDVLGEYTVTYNVIDSNGAVAEEKTRLVTVILPDTEPDNFTLADKLDARTWETVIRTFTVGGITDGVNVPVMATGDAEVSNGNDSFDASTTATLGTEIQVRIIASEHYETSLVGGCEINGVADSFTVTTVSSGDMWTDKDLGSDEDYLPNEDF